MSDLKENLKAQIIEQLNLEDLTPADIQDDAPLFGDQGLGLDSIDALEFIVLLDSNYGIKITDPSEGKEIFQSVNTLAAYISKHQ
ncbi:MULTISPECIES: phosphopantetheine-binding protein [Fluviicola]|jgi:acyl carrier protein|uniref:phosphopantetheine-binding protein n=1 Tax=Fluviicola TaxID=332102 RepID=UPI003137F977